MSISLANAEKPFIFRLIALIIVSICLVLWLVFSTIDFGEAQLSIAKAEQEEFISEPINSVYEDKDGWFYYIETIPDYQKTNLFKEEQLLRIKANLEEIKTFLSEKGIGFYLIIAPNKNTIYPEYMPTNIKQNEGISRLEQVYSYIEEHTDLNIIKVRDELLAEKSNNRLYYKTDTHWNQEGGKVACDKLLKAVNNDYSKVPLINLEKFNKTLRNSEMKDLAIMLERQNEFEETEYIYTPKKNTLEILNVNEPSNELGQGVFNEMNDRGETYHLSKYIKIRNTSLKDGLRLYMIRDSFGVNMMPFINESFYQCTYEWTSRFDKNNILNEEPDIVIFELVERYLQSLLG